MSFQKKKKNLISGAHSSGKSEGHNNNKRKSNLVSILSGWIVDEVHFNILNLLISSDCNLPVTIEVVLIHLLFRFMITCINYRDKYMALLCDAHGRWSVIATADCSHLLSRLGHF